MIDRSKATTHAEVCWSWGPAHYECAVREIERLRKMHQDVYQRGLQAGSRGLREMYDAIQEVKRQDAWGNTRLTEALMAAEERAERAEAENKRLREELSKMRAEPSDEEIDAIIGKHFQLPGNACRAHVAIAEVLRAQPAASAEPVAWVAADTLNSPHPTCVSSLAYMSQLDKDRGREYVPLYAAPQASEAAHGQRGWDVTDDMRAAVRFAPSSAYWSERLREFFGPDAREGIDALEKQLREARYCQKCNGTGTQEYRFHGVWANGEECVEPIKCEDCEGLGHLGDENGGHRLVEPDHETALALADAPRSLRDYVSALQAENERLLAERDALARDAERYRWLKKSAFCNVWARGDGIALVVPRTPTASIDSKIDAAMQRTSDGGAA